MVNLEDKIVLITGATSGLGKAAAQQLAEKNAHLVLLSRNKEKGEKIRYEIIQQSHNNNIDLLLCDLASLNSVYNATKEFKEKYPHLDILINNAGVIHSNKRYIQDGYDNIFGVNYLSHFLLTNKLLDVMKKQNARIINISSIAHRVGQIDFSDINVEKRYNSLKAYAQSKLAIVMFTYELARRLSKINISVNCLDPGGVKTNIGHDKGYVGMFMGFLNPFFQSPERGAEALTYLTTLEHITGAYFRKKKQINSSNQSYNQNDALLLWNKSLEMLEKVYK
jgi:NAD(P)-dependent dehydrogenase (short-subunit alcohol dehydrogenase family)